MLLFMQIIQNLTSVGFKLQDPGPTPAFEGNKTTAQADTINTALVHRNAVKGVDNAIVLDATGTTYARHLTRYNSVVSGTDSKYIEREKKKRNTKKNKIKEKQKKKKKKTPKKKKKKRGGGGQYL